MSLDLLVFTLNIDPVVVASVAVWSLALYLALSQLNNWMMAQLVRWFDYAERTLYTSVEEFERTRSARESQNSFYASILSIIPFFGLGGFAVYLWIFLLDQSWALSTGILAAIGCGIYELGRRTGEES